MISAFNTPATGPVLARTGAILRDSGAPLDTTGDVGTVYLDVSQNPPTLYLKREPTGVINPWGHYVFTLPSESGPPVNLWSRLKWYGDAPPYPEQPPYDAPTVGNTGDYYIMWQGPQTPGVYPRLFGPKGYSGAPGWPEAGDGGYAVQAPVSLYTAIGVAPTGQPTAPPNYEDGVAPSDPLYTGNGCLTLEGVAFYGATPDAPTADTVTTSSIHLIGLATLGITFPGTLNPEWDYFGQHIFEGTGAPPAALGGPEDVYLRGDVPGGVYWHTPTQWIGPLPGSADPAVDGATIAGNGESGTPLHVVAGGLSGLVPGAADGTTIGGNGLTATPFRVIPAGLNDAVQVAVAAPITGSGTSSSPLGLNIATTIADILANGGLNDAVQSAASSPLTGNGTSGSPLGLSIAATITALLANGGLNDNVQVAADGTTVAGNGTSGSPLHVVAGGLSGGVSVAVDGTSIAGNGLTATPLHTVTGGTAVAISSPLSGNGKTATPLTLDIPTTTTDILLGGGLNSHVSVAVDGSTITGNGLTATPLVSHFTGLGGVTAPLQGVGTSGSPLNINLATLATDLADKVPVTADGSTITGNGTTSSPLVATGVSAFGLQAWHDPIAGVQRGFSSFAAGAYVFATPQPDTNYVVMVQCKDTVVVSGTGPSNLPVDTLEVGSKTTTGFNVTVSGGTPSLLSLAVFR